MKMTSLKRCLSGLLAALMVLTLLPSTARADTVASGTCGDNLTWKLDSTGTLTISGTGEMEDYYYSWYTPWHDYTDPWSSSRASPASVTMRSPTAPA